eukprot:jgi/Botrbrau1/19834/Bobra.0124s0071.4
MFQSWKGRRGNNKYVLDGRVPASVAPGTGRRSTSSVKSNTWIRGQSGNSEAPANVQSSSRFKWELGGGRGSAQKSQQSGADQVAKNLKDSCGIKLAEEQAGRGRGGTVHKPASLSCSGQLPHKRNAASVGVARGSPKLQRYSTGVPAKQPAALPSATTAGYKRSKPHQLVRMPLTNQHVKVAMEAKNETNGPKQRQDLCTNQGQQQLIRIGQRKLVRKVVQKPPPSTANRKQASVWVRGSSKGVSSRQLRPGRFPSHFAIGPRGRIIRRPGNVLSSFEVPLRPPVSHTNFMNKTSIRGSGAIKCPKSLRWINPQAAGMSESRPGASKFLKRVAVPRFSSTERIQRLLPHKLVRINGHIYSVRQKAGKRTLVRQATMDKSATPVGVNQVIRRNIEKRGSTLKKGIASSSLAAARARVWDKTEPRFGHQVKQIRNRTLTSRSYCPVFCRTGVCASKENGACSFVHDKSKVSVCPRWLQGQCTRDSCSLQHRRCLDLMPVCTFFLQGICSQADCPYLHVNLDPLAPVCKDFMRGFCLRGSKCGKKHLTPRMMQELHASRVLVNSGTAKGKNQKRRGGLLGDRGSKRRRGMGPEEETPCAADILSVVPSFLQDLFL